MVMWPFRRKSGRKRPRSGTAHSDAEGSPRITHAEGVVTRGALKKKQRTEPASSRQMGRRYSFSPGRQDSLATDGRRVSAERHGQPARGYEQGAQSEQPWTRTPTLHHKQTNRNRRGKSHKKKMEERARAAEIKAMSNFDPVRPAAEPWMAGRPMKRESKKARAAPGFGVPRTSDVSLPLPDPMDSNMSSDSEYHSFKVSALDSLAPRPTLRYAPGPRGSPTRPPRTAQSNKQGQQAIVDQDLAKETGFRRHKRIDDLADGLDASGLREMMEREDRRRERKRQKDRERAVRRLARKAEQQKAEEAEARKAGTPPPENLERGVAGRELVGLGIDPASAVRTSSKHRRSTSPPRRTSTGSPEIAETAEPSNSEKEERRKSPVESFLRPESMVLDDEKAAEEDISDDEKRIERPPQPPSPQVEPSHKETLQDESIQKETPLEGLPDEKPPQPLSPNEPKAQDSYPSLQHSSRLGSLLRLRRTKSKSTVGSERVAEDSTRKSTTSSELKRRFSLSKLFRWGSRRFRKNTAQSSFSNTSRDEMMAAVAAAKNQTPAQANAEALARLQGQDISTEPNSGYYLSRKSGSVRTKSRFREELPEFPLSPPDSRVQSPEAEPPLPVVEEHSNDEVRTQPIPIPGASESQKSKSISTEGPSPDPQPLSVSMASIDSEGSWLSGRVKSQKSQRSSAMRESLRRANQLQEAPVSTSPAHSTEEEEDHAIANDAYMARLTPTQHLGMFTNQRHGDGRPSSDDEDYFDEDGAKWGDVASRPQLIEKTRRSTLKSQEGLLNIESEDEEMTGGLPSPKPSLKDEV